MKRIFLWLFLMLGFAFSADLQKFTGPGYKTATVINTTQVYASVDSKSSQTGAVLGYAKAGQSLEVVGVYSPFLKLQSKATGWAWVELLSVIGDSASCDQNTEGRLGVALANAPNDYSTITGALNQGDSAKVLDYWPRWVKVKWGAGVGLVFATEVKLAL